MYNKNTYNKYKYRGVDRETIIYEAISKINWATGPTGFSTVESIIDEDGNLLRNISPYADSTVDINSQLEGLYTNRIFIDKNAEIANNNNNMQPTTKTLCN